MTRSIRLIKEGIWTVIGQASVLLGTIFIVRILTDVLHPAQYGMLTLGLTLAAFINQVILSGIVSSIGRHYSIAEQKGELFIYLGESLFLMLKASLFLVFFWAATILFVLYFVRDEWIGFLSTIFIFSLLSGYNVAIVGILNAARRRVDVAIINSIGAFLRVLFLLIIIMYFAGSNTQIIVSYTGAAIVVFFIQLYFLRKLIPVRIARDVSYSWPGKMWGYALPYSIWGIFTWLLFASDKWALSAFGSLEDVGHFAVLYQLGYAPVVLASGMFASFIEPIMFQRAGDATDIARKKSVHHIIWRMAYMMLFIVLTLFIITYAWHDLIFDLLVGSEYTQISALLPWAVLAGGLFSVGQLLTSKLLSELKQRSLMVVKIGTAMFGVGFNIFGAYYFGIAGVVAAMLSFSAFYLIWMLILSRNQV